MRAAESDEGVLEVARLQKLVLSTTLDHFLCPGDQIDSGDPINPGNPGAPASHTTKQALQFSPTHQGLAGVMPAAGDPEDWLLQLPISFKLPFLLF